MKRNRFTMVLTIIVLFAFWACKQEKSIQTPLVLTYDTPAAQWKESLPIGNGRMGTMIQGHVLSDTLVINEETIWTGGPHDYANISSNVHLDSIRQLIRDKKYKESIEFGDKHMIGTPSKLQTFQPLGSVVFHLEHKEKITDYKRTLDLDNAVVKISYKCGGETYTREFFASHPGKAMIMRFTTTDSEGIKMRVEHLSDQKNLVYKEGNLLIIEGKCGSNRGIEGAIRFNAAMQVKEGAPNCYVSDNGIRVNGAKEFVMHYVAASNFKGYNDVSGKPKNICLTRLQSIHKKSYSTLESEHIADYSELFKRFELNLGDSEVPNVTTDKLIASFKEGNSEPYLDVLFYQMSRYLTIASSRVGSQPMNLQGIWNNAMRPAWDCKWTLNINLPLNYWLTEGANLSECHEPVFRIIRDLHKTGQSVAKEHYRCRGFVAHHNTDLWRAAAPVDGANWGLWTFGGAWLTRHLWEHYQYTQDMEFLEDNYHIMKDASLFFFDFLMKNEKGELVTSPSVSFEQSYKLPNGDVGRLCEGPTMDNQILRDLFSNCLQAALLLGDDQGYMDSLKLVSSQLRPNQIDEKTGEIMEWAFEAQPKPYCGQLAPLWGVNPGLEINPIETPEMAQAAITTIRNRDPHVVHYETSGSWMSGTRANFWARLYQGDDCYRMYQKTVHENLFSNMLVSFYPQKFFMIDGNLGTAASFNEMIVQSQRQTKDGNVIVDILPSLPSVWPKGEVKGICVRGGIILNIAWEKGLLKNVKVVSDCTANYELRYNNKIISEGRNF